MLMFLHEYEPQEGVDPTDEDITYGRQLVESTILDAMAYCQAVLMAALFRMRRLSSNNLARHSAGSSAAAISTHTRPGQAVELCAYGSHYGFHQ